MHLSPTSKLGYLTFKADFPLSRFSMGSVSCAPFIDPAVRPKTASMETQPYACRNRKITRLSRCLEFHTCLRIHTYTHVCV